MNPRFSSIPGHPSMGRRRFVQVALASVTGVPLLMACSPEVTPFKSTDVTGATFAQDFRLKDHHGNVRALADFKGKIVVTFFGFTQCPDVCPTAMATLKQFHTLMKGSPLEETTQVVLISLDDLQQKMLRGEIEDGFTLAALAHYFNQRLLDSR